MTRHLVKLGYLILLLVAPRLAAQTWDGGSALNSNWSSVTNWVGEVAPATNGTAKIVFAGSTRPTPNADTNWDVAGITFSNNATAFTLGGSPLTIRAGGITNNSANAQTINDAIVMGAAQSWNAVAGAITIAGTVTNSGFLLTIPGAQGTTISGAISGAGGLTKSGAGSLTLSGASTFSGVVTLNAGLLIARHASALGATAAGTTVGSGATLQLDNNIAIGAEALTLNGNGVAGNGALQNASGANSLAGAITVNADTAIGSAAGTLTLSGNLANGGNNVTFTGAGNITLTGILSGAGDVTNNCTGTLTLGGTAANTFSGTFLVNSGTVILNKTAGIDAVNTLLTIGDGVGGANADVVRLAADNQINSGNAVTIKSSGLLDLNGFSDTVLLTTMEGGAVTTGNGTLTMAGTLTVPATATTTATISGNLALGANRSFTVNDGSAAKDLSIDAVVSGAFTLTKLGTGTMTLAGSNTFSGATTVSAGALNLQNGSALGATNVTATISSGAALELEGGIAVGNKALTISGTGLSSGGALRNISGANSWGGAITLGAATLIASDAGTMTLNGAVNTAARALTVGGAGAIVITGVVSSTGALTVSGPGTLTLAAANSYSGGTTINGGTLLVNNSSGSGTGTGSITVNSGGTLGGTGAVSGAVTVNGAVSPGPVVGTLATGAETWNGAGTYVWEMNNATGTKGANSGWDWLNVSGALTINATSANKFTIKITSATLGGAPGQAANFDNTQSNTWIIATASGGITGFDATDFTLDVSAFQNNLGEGLFILTRSGNDLKLTFMPTQADVATTKTGPAIVTGSANFNYTITVTNAGHSTANSVVVRDTIPPTTTFFSASGGGTYSAGVVTWPALTLTNGATTNFTLTVTAPASGELLNSVASTSSTFDVDPSNNNGTSAAAQVNTSVAPNGSGAGSGADLPNPPSNYQTIPAGSLVIPMDNTLQALVAPFNLKAYGLANRILQNYIPIKWAIRAGKAKDAVDFTASAFQISPTAGATSSVSFAGGPFIVHRDYAGMVRSIIAAYSNSVAVYQLTADTSIDIRYDVRFRPQPAINTVNGTIHGDLFTFAGITNFTYLADASLLAGSCFTIFCEPHNGSTNGVKAVRDYILSGGNFIAECLAIDTYENAVWGKFQSSAGIVGDNIGNTLLYDNPDLAFSQFIGTLNPAPGGSHEDWYLNGGTFINNGHVHLDDLGASPQHFQATASKLYNGEGGMVFYIGGHNYGAGGNDITMINGQRMVLNAVFVPNTRSTCSFDLGPYLRTISGTVYEDVNGDSSLADGVGRPNVRVRLYADVNNNGIVDTGDTFLTETTTDANGNYSFAISRGLSGDKYLVTVDSKSVTPSAGFNGGFSQSDVWAEQTYGDDSTTATLDLGARYGGRNAGTSDVFNVSSTVPANNNYQHVARMDVAAGNPPSVNFGFSFNVVTHLRGGDNTDDDATANRTIQGSLRQFIQNANAIAGPNVMRFVPAVPSNANGSGGNWWRLDVTSQLPAISNAFTTVDGTAYSSTDGVTVRDDNSGNSGNPDRPQNEAVGTGADGIEGTGDETLLPSYAKPEFEINGGNVGTAILQIVGNNTTVAHVAFYNHPASETAAVFIKSGTGSLVNQCYLGPRADGTDPGVALQTYFGVIVSNATASVTGSFVAYTKYTGIEFIDAAGTISGNDVYGASLTTDLGDGISSDGLLSQNITISQNRVDKTGSYSMDYFEAGGALTITDNSLYRSHQRANVENGGLRVFGQNSTVQHNVVTTAGGAGIVVVRDTAQPTGTRNRISQNAIYNNGTVGIDLDVTTTGAGNPNGDGVTPNNGATDATKPNIGLDYPIITNAVLNGTTLVLSGYVGTPSNILAGPLTLEFFKADTRGTNTGAVIVGDGLNVVHGSPRWYLNTYVAASGTFNCTITLPAAVPVTPGDPITATATDGNGNTSEAANNIVAVAQADLSISKTGPAGVLVGSNFTYTVTVTNLGPAIATNVVAQDSFPAAVTFISASGGGTTNASNVVTWPTIVSFPSAAITNFTVTVNPTAGGALTNAATVTSITPDLGTNNNSVAFTNNATFSADLWITKAATNSILAGSNLVYTITVTNVGPSPASSVVVTDTLPASVTFLNASAGGTTNASGAVFWPPIATFVGAASTNFTITVKPPPTGILTNTALTGSPTPDPVSTNNVTPPVISTVIEQADLQIFKTGTNSVFATSNLVYTITVTNAGPSTATSLVVTDNLPATATFISANPAATTNASNQAIWSSLGNLAAGSITTLSLTVKAPVTGILTNTAVAVSPTLDPVSTNNITPPVTSTVTELADLVVTKTGPASVNATNNVTYSITVTNNGPSTASSLVITDSLPANVTFLSATSGGATNASLTNVFWTVSSLANGAFTNLGLTVKAPATGAITNNIFVGSATADPTPGATTNRFVTTVTDQADLVVSKTGPASVNATNNVTYSITVTNNGPSTASSLVITDSLPANVTFLSATSGGTTNASLTNVFWNVSSLANGAFTNLGVTVRAPATGAITNNVVVGSLTGDPTPGPTTNQVVTTVTDQADLVVTKTGPATVNATNNVTYSITVTNNGPSTAASLVITDSLPANVTFLSATSGGATNASLTNVFWSVSSLANGAFTNLGVTVRAPATGAITNNVLVGSPTGDPTPGPTTNQVVTTVTDQADLVVTKTGPASVNATNNVTYSITVTNNGPSTATSLVITDSLPANVTFLSATSGGATNASLTNVFWSVSSLANGAFTNLGVTVRAPATGVISNVVVTGSATGDPSAGNNSAGPFITTVTDQADLVVTKTGPASINATNNVTYTIAVTNNGPSTATSLVITDSLPANVTFISATSSGATNASLTNVFWSVSSLANGAFTNVSVTVRAPATGAITNNVVVGSPTGDPTPGPTTNQVVTTVTDQADLVVTKTGPASVNATNQFSYAIAVTNHGPSTATSVVITDSLPANLTFLSATGGGTTNASLTNVFWTVPSLASGSFTNLGVTVKAPATGILSNSVVVGSPTDDPTPGNNAAGPFITTVTDQADLVVTKTGPASVNATNQFSYAIAVTNNGPSTATSLVITDSLPANVTFLSATSGGATNASLTNVFWSVSSLANGAFTNLGLTVKAPATGVLSNSVVVGSPTDDPTPANNAAGPFITTVIDQADLVALKSGPGSIAAAANYDYTITITNHGPSTATSLVVTDQLPTAVTFISATGGGFTNASGAVIWNTLGTLASGGSTDLTVTVKAPAGGSVTNSVLAGSATSDPDLGNNTSPLVISTVNGLADLVVTKTGPASVNATNQFNYAITVTNHGPSTATSLVITDSLPLDVTFISATAGGTTNASLTNVFWSISSLANGAFTNLGVTVKAPATGSISNSVVTGSATTDPTPDNNSAGPFVTTVTDQADLVVTKTGPATVNATNQFNYAIAVTNNGPSTATSVVITDSLPANLTFLSATGGGTTNASLTNVFWTVPSLASGAFTNLGVTVKAPATGILSNSVVVGSPTDDPTPANNSAGPFVTTVTDQADLVVTKTGPATVNATNQFNYAIAVTNNGPSTATSVVITDSLPANLTFLSATGGGTTNASLTNVFWTVPSLASGSFTNLGVTVKAPATGILSNSVVVGSPTDDPTPGNNAAGPFITTVTDQADLVVTKTGPASVNATNQFSYAIAVTNNGPSTATSLVITDSLPANVTFLSATSGGATNASLTNVFWSVSSLANGAFTNLGLTVKAPATGVLSNSVVVGSPTDDPTPANNAAGPFITTVIDQADLVALKSGPGSIAAAANYDYTITITNHGPSTATSLVVTDQLPTAVTFISATGGGFTNASGAVIWNTLGTLASGGSTDLTVTVKAPAGGSVTNSVLAGSATSDPDLGNNTSPLVISTVNGLADLVVTKTGPASVNATNQFNYAITVTNHGPSTATSLVITDSLPLDVTFISATAGGTTNASLTNVFWSISSLANGAFTNLGVTVKAPATGSISNSVVTGSATTDPTPDNNSAGPFVTTVTDQADLVVTKTGPATVNATNQFNYAIAVTNNGPSTATSVVITDSLPANLTFLSATGGGTTNASLTNVFWTVPSLASGAFTNLGVTVKAPATGILSNSVVVGSPTDDPTPANNSAGPFVTTVTDQADLVVTKTGPATVNATNQFNYAIAVTNNGPSTATSVVITDSLPANLTFLSATGGGTTNASLTNVFWTVPSLASGSFTNLGVTVKAPATGILSNSVVVGSPTDDPTPGNNAAGPFITTVTDQADLVVTKTGPASVNATNQFSYAIAVTNNGPSTATSLVITDSLPANVTFLSATSGGATNASLTNVFWSVSSLANGAFTNLGLTVKAPATGVLSNSVVVGSPTDDPTPANNAAGPFITTVIDQADLVALKSGPGSIAAAANYDYTITITNHGPSTATSLVVTDQLPTAVTFISATGGGFTNASGAVIWNTLGTLASGGSTDLTVTVKAPAGGSVTNSVLAGSATSDPDLGNNTSPLVISTVNGLADLVVTKTGPASVNATNQFNYAITVTNHGPSTATSLVITDSLPLDVTFISATAGGTTNASLTNVFWSISSLANGAFTNLGVTVKAPATGSISNSVVTGSATTDPTPDNNSAGPFVTTVTDQADLVVTKTGPATVNATNQFNYAIAVTNNGPSTATSVVITDSLPANLTFLSATGGGTTNASLTNVFWTVPSLASGAFTNLGVTVKAPATGILSNSVVVGSPTDDPTPANNSAGPFVTTVTDQADLVVTKTGPATVNATNQFNYAIAVTNNGPSTATSVVITDSLPANLTFLSATGGGTTNASLTNVFWTVPSLASGSFTNLGVTVKAPATGILSNSVVVGSPTDDPTPGNNAAGPFITTVTDQADLVVTKTGPASVNATNQFSYAIAVTNNGPSTATSLVITDSLPANVTFLSATSGGATNASLTNVFWSVSSLANGAFTNLGLTVKAPATGVLSNSVVVGSPTDDPTPANNAAGPFITTVIDQADLVALKSGPGSIAAAANYDYTITITNHGPSTATSLVVTDQLPTAVTFISATGGGFTNASGAVIWNTLGTLASGGSTDLTVTVKAPAGGSVTNSVLAGSATSDPDLGNNTSPLVISTVNGLADLVVTKTGPASVNATNQFNYAITVTNHGPSTATSLVITDSLPLDVTFISATAGGTTNASLTNVFWSISSLANGAFTNLGVTVKAPATGSISNSVVTGSATTDPTPDNNSAGPFVTTVTDQADLVVTKTGPATVNATNQFNYAIAVTNNGPSTATSVVITDSLPANLTFLSATGGGTTNASLTNVFWTVPSLASGAFTNLGVTVKAPATGILSNSVVVGSPTDDPTPANNSAGPFVTTVTDQADLVVTKTGPATVNATNQFNYAIAVTNNGPSTATSVVITDSLPANLTFLSATGGGTTNASLTNVFWTVPSLASGAFTNLGVTVKAPATGILSNSVVVGSPTDDPTPANNSAGPFVTTVTDQADLVVTKTGPATVNATNQFNYAIAVTNNGPSTATSVVITDSLPANLTFLSATGGGTTNASLTNVFWTVPSLASGAFTNLGVTVKAPATGILSNSVVVGSPTDDPTPANNSAGPFVTTVTDQADLVVTKTGPATVNATNQFNYAIAVTNNGPSTATSVVITDSLPANLTFLSATGGGTTNASLTNVFWTVPSLASGAFTNLGVTVKAPATGILSNSVVVGSPTDDPTPANNSAGPFVTTVTDQADLVVTKTGPATVNATNQFNYAIAVTNNGPSTATSVVITDSLPANLTFLSATGGGTTNASLTNVFWTVPSLASGSFTNLGVTVKAPATGILSNSVVVGSPTDDPTPGNNAAGPFITTVTDQADLVALKSGPGSIAAAANYDYTITITNHGPSTATSLVVTDQLPTLVTFISATGGATTNASGAVIWSALGSLPSGGSTDLTVTVKAPAGGSVTNSVLAGSATSDPNLGNNTSPLVISTVNGLADLVVTKTGPASVNATNNVTYSITVTNHGPSTATSLVITDSLPANVTFLSATDGGTTNASLTNVFWSISSLANGAFTNLGVTVKAPATGSISNSVVTGSSTTDPTPGNNSAGPFVTTVTDQADLVVTKTGPASVNATNQFSYAIAVTNNGPSTATSLVITDSLPANVTFLSATDGGTTNASLTNVFWTVPSLASGAFTNLSVTVKAPATGIVSNSVVVGSPTGDPTPGNNSAGPFITTVTDQADLVITKTGPASVNATNQFSYAIAVTNNGPSTATSLVITDSLPADVTFVSATSGGATNASGEVIWTTLGNLAAGASTNLGITVRAPASGIVTNTASAGSATPDSNGGNNNSGPVITTVAALADLATAKSGPANVNAGQDATYTLSVTNNGPSTATGVLVTDTLPTNTVFVSATGGGVHSGGVVTWSLFSLGNGSVSNFTVIVTAPAGGILTNSMSATSPVTDPNGGNNTNFVITAVNLVADVQTTKSGPANATGGGSVTYSIAVTNAGPSVATNIVATDTLPVGVVFVSATGGGTEGGGVVTWPAFSLGNGAGSNFTVIVTAPTSGILTNVAASVSPVSDPVPGNNNGTAANARVITALTTLFNVTGTVYSDANHNATQDGSEAGTGLTLYTKLIGTNGVALAAATVNPTTGAYSLPATAGTYTVIVDDNNNLADVTPTIPAGWVGTEIPNQTRPAVVVVGANAPSQNFGLFNGARLTGTVFVDTGIGSGTANDGIRNGSEAGLASVAVRLTDGTGATVYDTAITDGGGSYTLFVPALAGAMRITATNLTGYVSTGASVGNTGGTYDRATDTITFTNVAGTPLSGVNFGDAPVSSLTPDHQQTALPGTVVFYPHIFTAGSAGTVTFAVTDLPTPAVPGWQPVVYIDSNCNGIMDAGEPIYSGAITVTPGQKVCVIVKETVPVQAPFNAQDAIALTANFTYTGATPALAASVTRNDLTTVGSAATAGLVLIKEVDKATAKPGETLTYTITYQNNSSGALTNIVVHDQTPAYTAFQSAEFAMPLPANLSTITVNAPAVGATGSITWQCTGALDSGKGGTVNFSVIIAP